MIGDYVKLRDGAICHGVTLLEDKSVRRDPLGGRTAKVIAVEEVTNSERGTFTRVTLEWWGLDVSGHFAERRLAYALKEDCEDFVH